MLETERITNLYFMPFEPLSFRHSFEISNFPARWLPLLHLYDPDLPLYPIYYFHKTEENNRRPSEEQRVYGYIEKVNLKEIGGATITVITNKNLERPANVNYKRLVLNEVNERLGLINPVTIDDIRNTFTGPLVYANGVLTELWHKVVGTAYGNKLPFGKLWDEVFGLTRFVSSFNSPGGRKGELIQTHYFSTRFGERMQCASDMPKVDFYLLPTINELTDLTNPLSIFPLFRKLVDVANVFRNDTCIPVEVGNIELSKFTNPGAGRLTGKKLKSIFARLFNTEDMKSIAEECFNTFDKGAPRTIIYLMMLSDIRQGRLKPSELNSQQFSAMYTKLKGSYQSPKVIHIWAQQAFGNPCAVPVDVWVKTFFKWPLNIGKDMENIFLQSRNLGKTERLIWVSAQARKVHSSACNDAIWCIKKTSKVKARGANPFACNICDQAIRNVCPAYAVIRDEKIVFNSRKSKRVMFKVKTGKKNNRVRNQKFTVCEGESIYSKIIDDFSPGDVPNGFGPYPHVNHDGQQITVSQFIDYYHQER